jgi:hypothetical protein
VTLRLAVIVLAGAAVAPAALFGPSWVDHRNNPHITLSQQRLDFQTTPVNARAEQLITIRNNGHAAIAAQGGSLVLHNYEEVCPPRLGVHRRMLDCGFSVDGASDPACEALRPGLSCAVAITFTPRVPGRYAATYCFEFVSMTQDWRKTRTCLLATGRGGKSASAR